MKNRDLGYEEGKSALRPARGDVRCEFPGRGTGGGRGVAAASRLLVAALPLLMGTGLALAAAAPQGVDAEASGQHAGHQAPAAAIDHAGARWAPDAPLQTGMRRVRDALARATAAPEHAATDRPASDLAAEVRAATSFMFANCKLPPEPDVALHGILASLLAGAQALEKDPRDRAAVAAMQAALQEYPRQFDDPGFALPAPPAVRHAH